MPQQRLPYNPRMAVTYGGQVYDPANDPLGIGAASSARDARFGQTVADMDSRASSPLLSMFSGQSNFVSALPGWDQFFGRLADLERGANAQGYDQKVDYLGRGPGTGFGTLKTETVGGQAPAARQPGRRQSMQSLQSARW